MALSIIPRRPSYAGDAFASGVGTYLNQTKQNKDMAFKHQALQQNQSQFQQKQSLDLSKLDYQKKRDLGTLMNDAVKQMSKDQSAEYLADPQVLDAYKQLNMAPPHGVYREEKEATLEDYKEAVVSQYMKDPTSVSKDLQLFAGIGKAAPKIDLKEGKEAIEATIPIPWYEHWWPGYQTKQGQKRKDMEKEMQRRYLEQIGLSVGLGQNKLSGLERD